MESIESTTEPQHGVDRLHRTLGVGFGLAIVIGGTIGVGILRSPGAIAEQLPSPLLIMAVWIVGGLYSMLGANYMAELATAVPRAGGPYVYAHRAIGPYGGFVVGWGDWLLNTLSLSYMCIVFAEYAGALFYSDGSTGSSPFAVGVLLAFTLLNLIGLRAGSGTQNLASLLKALAFICFIAVCFVYGGGVAGGSAGTPTGFPLVIAFILAFQLVLGTYSGWFSCVYFAEEDRDPAKNLPRSLFGGVLLIIVIYVLVNAAILYVLPIKQLAASKFAGAEAISAIFGEPSAKFVTVLAVVSIMGIINATIMLTPRTLLALGRDGLFFRQAAAVNAGGNPWVATAITVIPALAFVVFGTFETLVAVAEFFAVTNTILLVTSLFLLRRREPDLPRPFKAWAYPIAPFVMLLGAILLFLGYIVSNFTNSMVAVSAIVLSYPLFLIVRRRNRVFAH